MGRWLGCSPRIPVIATYYGSVDIRSPGRLDSLRRVLIWRGAGANAEGHPLALTMAAGLPTIATRCGVELVLGDGALTRLADVGDAVGLAKGLEAVFAAEDAVAEMPQGAQSIALKHDDNIAVLTAYERMYGEMLQNRGCG
jgi:hypothetical protein